MLFKDIIDEEELLRQYVDNWVKYQDVQYDQLRIIFNYCRQLKYITCVTCCKV